MSWDLVGNAVQAAVEQAVIYAGLPSGRVLWKRQNVNAPPLDYVAISIGGMILLGIDFVDVSATPGTPPRGQELTLTVRGRREVPLEIECFTNESISGRESAANLLYVKITMGLALPSVKSILSAQGISAFDPGTPTWIGDVPAVKFRGRAVGTVRCYMPPPTVAEYVGYIERVSGNAITSGTKSGAAVVQPFDTGPTD